MLRISDYYVIASPRAELRASPGQFFLAVPPTFDPYLPRAIFPFRMRQSSVETFLVPPDVHQWADFARLQLRGPYGRGFALPREARRALVLMVDAVEGAHLLAWIEQLVEQEIEVSVLCGREALDDSLLPPQVEYRVAEDLTDASRELWNWADALYASGSAAFYNQLQRAAPRMRLDRGNGWAQILFREMLMPCGTGVCYACALKTRGGIALNCQDGPVFDLAEWGAEE